METYIKEIPGGLGAEHTCQLVGEESFEEQLNENVRRLLSGVRIINSRSALKKIQVTGNCGDLRSKDLSYIRGKALGSLFLFYSGNWVQQGSLGEDCQLSGVPQEATLCVVDREGSFIPYEQNVESTGGGLERVTLSFRRGVSQVLVSYKPILKVYLMGKKISQDPFTGEGTYCLTFCEH